MPTFIRPSFSIHTTSVRRFFLHFSSPAPSCSLFFLAVSSFSEITSRDGREISFPAFSHSIFQRRVSRLASPRSRVETRKVVVITGRDVNETPSPSFTLQTSSFTPLFLTPRTLDPAQCSFLLNIPTAYPMGQSKQPYRVFAVAPRSKVLKGEGGRGDFSVLLSLGHDGISRRRNCRNVLTRL